MYQQVRDDQLNECVKLVKSVMAPYDGYAQSNPSHRQRLTWKLSRRTLKQLRPTGKIFKMNTIVHFFIVVFSLFYLTKFLFLQQKNWSACCLLSKRIANLAKFRNAIVVQPDPVRAKCVQFLLASCRRCLCRFRPKKIWLCFSNTTYLPSTRSVFCSVWKKR